MQLPIYSRKSPSCLKISPFAFLTRPVNFNGKCSKLPFRWHKSAANHIFRLTFDKFCKSPSFNKKLSMVKLFTPLSFFKQFGLTLCKISYFLQNVSFFGIKCVILHKICLFVAYDLLLYLFELHILLALTTGLKKDVLT